MSDIVSRKPGPVSRGSLTTNGSIARLREADTYNRSALALKLDNSSFPLAQPARQLTLKRYGPASAAPATPMFRGLDQYASNRDRGSGILAFFIHLLVAVAIVWLGTIAQTRVVQPTDTAVVAIPFTLYDPPPPPVMPVAKVRGGGGGGGAHRLVVPNRGYLPKVAKLPILRPEVARVELPKLPVEPTVQVSLPQQTTLPKLGVPQSPQVALASQGSGSNSGFGMGALGGIGSGHGNGQGPGGTGGYGGGLMNVGGGVSAPQVIYSPDPQFTAEARQANFQGIVGIQLIVDSQGNPQDVRVARHLGMGLDERAVEAVRQYRFKPAVYQGRPVSVQMIIDVDFRLH